MEKIGEVIHLLTTKYLTWTLSAIIVFIILMFFIIIYSLSKMRKNAEKSKEIFIHESVESLTPEEIENISKNSSNPKAAKEFLENEVDEARKNSLKNKQKYVKPSISKNTKGKKTTNQPKKTEEVKNDNKVEVLETQTQENEAVKKTTKEDNNKKQVKTEEPKRNYSGKWKIIQNDSGYFATLTASNGSSLLQTENYKSLSSLKNGIETIKKNIELGNFAVSIDKNGHYRYKLFNLSNRLIFVSQDFSSKAKCESGIESVKRFSKDAQVIIEEK